MDFGDESVWGGKETAEQSKRTSKKKKQGN